MRALAALLRWLAGLTGVAIGCGLAVWLTLWVSLRSSAARVPDVRGQEPTQAVAAVLEAGLVGRVQEGVFDTRTAVGKVAVQKPAPGFQMKRGGTVLLYPSLGQATQRAPSLVGLPESVAESEVETTGLALGSRCQVDGQGNAVTVVAQQPQPGVLVAAGTPMSLLINRTPLRRRYVMPDFVGAREDVAVRVLRALGFRLATLQRVAYQGLAPGVVLRQDPQAGGPVLDAAVVALWVSR